MSADFDQTEVWTQRDGTPIRVVDMDDDHLNNTIAMLRRNAPQIYESRVIHYYLHATEPGGDMAQDMFDQEFEAALHRRPWDWVKRTPLVEAMRKERKRRVSA